MYGEEMIKNRFSIKVKERKVCKCNSSETIQMIVIPQQSYIIIYSISGGPCVVHVSSCFTAV